MEKDSSWCPECDTQYGHSLACKHYESPCLSCVSLRAEVERLNQSVSTIHSVSENYRKMFEDAHNDYLKLVDEYKPIRLSLHEKEQQIKNLEEYMLKGVAFRDELQAALSEKEAALLGAQNQRDEIMRVSHEDAAALCRARELVSNLAVYPATDRDEHYWRELQDTLSSTGPCRHEAALERYREAILNEPCDCHDEYGKPHGIPCWRCTALGIDSRRVEGK